MHPLLASALGHYVDKRHLDLARRGTRLLEMSLRPSSIKTRDYHYGRFVRWCNEQSCCPLPADAATLMQYMLHALWLGWDDRTKLCVLSAIARVHLCAGFEDPRRVEPLRTLLSQLRRKVGRRPLYYSPLAVDDLRRIVTCIPSTFTGSRDRALLLLAYAGALRSGMLVSIDIENVRVSKNHLIINLPGLTERPITIGPAKDSSLCPVRAVRSWLRRCGQTSGPLFRSVTHKNYANCPRLRQYTVLAVVRKYCAAAQLPKMLCAQSLRTGAIASAAAQGMTTVPLMLLGRFSVPEKLTAYRQLAEEWQPTSYDTKIKSSRACRSQEHVQDSLLPVFERKRFRRKA